MSGYPEGTIAVVEQPIPMVSFYQERLILNTVVPVPAGGSGEVRVDVEPNYTYAVMEVWVTWPSNSYSFFYIVRKEEEEIRAVGPNSGGYGRIFMTIRGGFFSTNYLKFIVENRSDEDLDYYLSVVGIKIPVSRTIKYLTKWARL